MAENISEQPPFSRLRVLQSNNQDLYYSLSALIQQFAVLGYVDVARRLLGKLNTYDRFHRQHVLLRPLWFLWDLTGEWPDGEEERVRENIEEDRKRTAEKAGGEEEPARKAKKLELEDKPITRHDIKAQVADLAHRYAKSWYWPDKPRRFLGARQGEGNEAKGPHERDLSTHERQEEIKKILQGIDGLGRPEFRNATTGGLVMDVSASLVSALDLTVQLSETGTTPETSAEEILTIIGKRMEANQQVQDLIQSRHVWPMLKEGALARILGIDMGKFEEFVNDFESTIDERFTNGRIRLEDLPMRTIMEMMERNNKLNPDAQLEDVGGPCDSPFKEPGTPEQIAEAEKRLNIELPDDYKEFLAISNGFGRVFGGIIYDPPLHPVKEIHWFSEDYFTDLALELLHNEPMVFLSNPVEVGKAIEIGTEDIDNTWLIPPSKVNEFKEQVREVLKSEEYSEDQKKSLRTAIEDFVEGDGGLDEFWKLGWACVTWASGGAAMMTGYPSFKAYVRSVAVEGEPGRKEDIVGSRKFVGYAFGKVESEAQE